MKKFLFPPAGKQTFQGVIIGLVAAFLTAILVIPIRFFIDGVVAAHRLSEYAASVYHVKSGAFYARYNPVSSARYMVLPQGGGADSVTLLCENNGNIYDSYRGDRLLADMGFPEKFRAQNDSDHRQYGYLRCCWKYNAPDEPLMTLYVGIRESEEPFPDSDAGIRAKMSERFQLYYGILPEEERESIDCAAVSYQHYAHRREDEKEYDQSVYSVSVEMRGRTESVDEVILYSKMIKSAIYPNTKLPS